MFCLRWTPRMFPWFQITSRISALLKVKGKVGVKWLCVYVSVCMCACYEIGNRNTRDSDHFQDVSQWPCQLMVAAGKNASRWATDHRPEGRRGEGDIPFYQLSKCSSFSSIVAFSFVSNFFHANKAMIFMNTLLNIGKDRWGTHRRTGVHLTWANSLPGHPQSLPSAAQKWLFCSFSPYLNNYKKFASHSVFRDTCSVFRVHVPYGESTRSVSRGYHQCAWRYTGVFREHRNRSRFEGTHSVSWGYPERVWRVPAAGLKGIHRVFREY